MSDRIQELADKISNGPTQFGYFCRALRTIHAEFLGDMAVCLGISASKLSGYEYGREPVPESVFDEIAKSYWLNERSNEVMRQGHEMQAEQSQ